VGALALAALSACGGAAATTTGTTTASPPASQPSPPATTAAPATTTPAAPATTTPAAPATTAPAPVAPAPPPAATVVVTDVIDGDTLVIATGQHVRLIGIDAPEKDHCGYAAATANLTSLVGGKSVVLQTGARDDVDKYGRLLRYVDLPDGTDTGLAQIVGGFAIARYDSRDGYGHHAREAQYVAADTGAAAHCITAAPAATTPTTNPGRPTTVPATAPAADGSVFYANCAAARAAGAAPLHVGEPGYRAALDRDHDGVACE
jgi:endonuclease YncB( thermonuclease family)